MKRFWMNSVANRQVKTHLRTLLQHLLIDVIPVLLLLAAMAYGMALVADKIAEPSSVEIQVISEKLS